MPVTKPTKSALEASIATRKALAEALRDIRAAQKYITKAGTFGEYIIDFTHPPAVPYIKCKNKIYLYPPRVPMFICRILHPPRVPTAICDFPPKPIRVTRKEFEMALKEIEIWIKYLIVVLDGVYLQPPAPRKRKLRK